MVYVWKTDNIGEIVQDEGVAMTSQTEIRDLLIRDMLERGGSFCPLCGNKWSKGILLYGGCDKCGLLLYYGEQYTFRGQSYTREEIERLCKLKGFL